eukprot:1159662-Pelagomonas_calceolata.AAC.11
MQENLKSGSTIAHRSVEVCYWGGMKRMEGCNIGDWRQKDEIQGIWVALLDTQWIGIDPHSNRKE